MGREFEKDLVSIVIPCYNSGNTIEKTIRSVLAQTYQRFEIIVVDDCSRDGSQKTLKQYEADYSQVKCVFCEQNGGAAVARNKGLAVATGQYVAFLDSDDVWVPDKLEKQLVFMKEKKAAFCYTSYDVIDADGNRLKNPLKVKECTTYKMLLTKTLIATPTVMIDREMTGDMLMPLRRTGQDYAFWLLLLRRFNAYGMQETLAHVCRRNNSLSKNKWQNIRDVWEVQTELEKINKIVAAANVFAYCVYAFKKRYFNSKSVKGELEDELV